MFNRDADAVTSWNTTLIEGRTLKKLNENMIISYQVRNSQFLKTSICKRNKNQNKCDPEI
jgi:hypothetical protein